MVLIGEASHGTREFYAQRWELTKLLVEQRGFTAVVAEADFPDAFRVNKYVRGLGSDRSSEESLRNFKVRAAGGLSSYAQAKQPSVRRFCSEYYWMALMSLAEVQQI